MKRACRKGIGSTQAMNAKTLCEVQKNLKRSNRQSDINVKEKYEKNKKGQKKRGGGGMNPNEQKKQKTFLSNSNFGKLTSFLSLTGALFAARMVPVNMI